MYGVRLNFVVAHAKIDKTEPLNEFHRIQELAQIDQGNLQSMSIDIEVEIKSISPIDSRPIPDAEKEEKLFAPSTPTRVPFKITAVRASVEDLEKHHIYPWMSGTLEEVLQEWAFGQERAGAHYWSEYPLLASVNGFSSWNLYYV